jgi:hypothetical protein
MRSPTLSRCIISTETPAVRPALHHPIANYTRMEYGWPTSGSEFTALYRSIRRHKRSVMITAQINTELHRSAIFRSPLPLPQSLPQLR